MTTPAPETIEREQGKLYLSDAELIRRLGVPEKHMRKILPGPGIQVRFSTETTAFRGSTLLAGSKSVAG
jgi:GMP synthase PP-ATPase subunit